MNLRLLAAPDRPKWQRPLPPEFMPLPGCEFSAQGTVSQIDGTLMAEAYQRSGHRPSRKRRRIPRPRRGG